MYSLAYHSRARDTTCMLLKRVNAPAATTLMYHCTSTLQVSAETAWQFLRWTTANHTTRMGPGRHLYDPARAVNSALNHDADLPQNSTADALLG